ncbi:MULTISPECIES: hypothetical protein [Clostridium]|jgi:uncharacterized protein YxeA|uniref:Uncharacterized protein n=1 Tax=Clostridium lapidicellarium TaxID=3240931 RepID=A0ABV4E0Y0_9CLOT
MRKRDKLIISLLVIVVMIAVVGIFLNKGISYGEFSNSYLTSTSDGDRSFFSHTNDMEADSGKSFDFGKFDGRWSLMEFTSPKNNKITITDDTKINNGKFIVVILDPNYNIISKTSYNNKTSLNFTTSKQGKYIIRIAGKKASGHFGIKIDSASGIDIKYNDFFG